MKRIGVVFVDDVIRIDDVVARFVYFVCMCGDFNFWVSGENEIVIFFCDIICGYFDGL